MPTILLVKGFRFFIYSNDHSPMHVHVEKGEGTAKFNLYPVELVKSKRFTANEIQNIRKLILENRELFLSKVCVFTDLLTLSILLFNNIHNIPSEILIFSLIASETERNNWRLIGGGEGIHWKDLDEDIFVEGLL
jgi:hypothetical protein